MRLSEYYKQWQLSPFQMFNSNFIITKEHQQNLIIRK